MSENTSLFSVYAENLKSVGGRTLGARQFAIVEFNRTMAKVIPWAVLEERLAPRYYDGKRGRPPFPLGLMLRIYLLALLHNYGDERVLFEVCCNVVMAEFCGVDPTVDKIPERTALVRFRTWLRTHEFETILAVEVAAALDAIGLELKRGTSVDSTLIKASSSTKNQAQSRDEEMSSTRKGEQYHFGMKLHVGVDSETGRVHSLECTTARVHDSQVIGELLHGEEQEVYGDKAYVGQTAKIREVAPQARDKTLAKARRKRPLTPEQEETNRAKNRVRARVEHCFRVLKCQFGYRQVRYRGLARNERHLRSLMALVNLYQFRRQLLAAT